MNNFDTPLNRRNTNTWKWDGEGFGVDFPMGTADTDFKMPIEVQKRCMTKLIRVSYLTAQIKAIS